MTQTPVSNMSLWRRVRQDARRQWFSLLWRVKQLTLARAEWIALSLIAALGLGLRLMFIAQPIRTDEAVTYLHYASRSLPLALANYSAPNNHLFHTFFAWISVHLLGNNEIALRLPAFLMGVLLIPVTYAVGSILANRRAGLLAAGLVAVSSVLIEYSTNARGYTLQCVLVGLSVLVAYSMQRSLSPTRWGLLALLLALGFYTVPTMLYPFGGIMLWLLAEIFVGGRQGVWGIRPWVLCGLLTAMITLVLYTPVLIVSGLSALISNQYVQPFSLNEFFQHLPDAAAHLWSHWHTSIPPIIAALLGLGALISLGRGLRVRMPLLIPCVIWSLVALTLQRVIPFERNWLPFLPLYFVSAAAGLIWIWDNVVKREALGWLIGGILISGLGANILITQSPYLSIETGTFRDAKAVVQDLQPLLHPEDRVIWEHPSGDSLAYYASQMGLDWETYAEWRDVDTLYLVLNTEYPQTLESVEYWSGIVLEEYVITSIRTYPQAELFKLEKKD